MQTDLAPEFQNTAAGVLAESVLRNCVHCGFCNATCPTYHLLADELDGPRGRIYQIKRLFEGGGDGAMRRHLDRCLVCRACEPACPSGVRYGALLEVGKVALDEKFPRTFFDRWRRRLLGEIIIRRRWFASLLKLGRCVRWMLPRTLADSVPVRRQPLPLAWPANDHPRKMIALAGCVQSCVAPATNLAAAVVLDRLGVALVEVAGAGCCGGVPLHTGGDGDGRAAARALIDRWWRHLDGTEAIVMTASGCGVTLKDYPRLFADDSEYFDKATRISEMSLDLCEVIARELPDGYQPDGGGRRVAFHAPCTLQHAQRLGGRVEEILTRAGHTVIKINDAHLCCGSAGTYSILQPKLSAQLRRAKQDAINAAGADVVCTANIGCQLQLEQGAASPNKMVAHWVELLL